MSGFACTEGHIFNSPNFDQYTELLYPQLWLKFDDYILISDVVQNWFNDGISKVNATSNNIKPCETFASCRNKSLDNLNPNFYLLYDPIDSVSYFDKTITLYLSLKTQNNFRSENYSHCLWHQGVWSEQNNEGLALFYQVDNDSKDEIYAQYKVNGVDKRVLITTIEQGLKDNTVYSIAFKILPDQIKVYVNGKLQGYTEVSEKIPQSSKIASFGSQIITNEIFQNNAKVYISNCLIWDKDIEDSYLYYMHLLT